MDREEVIKWLKIMKANLNTFPEINCGKKIEALAEAIRLLKNEQSEEPSSSEKPNKSEFSTGSTTKKCTTCTYREIDGKPHEMCKSCVCGNRYKQESCDDCVSRKAVLEKAKSYNTDGWDSYTPLVVDVEDIEELPSVIPIRPKGHWIGRKQVGFGEWEDVTVLVNLRGCVTGSCECSECGEWLTGSDEYECSARYCPNCGAKMEEVEE